MNICYFGPRLRRTISESEFAIATVSFDPKVLDLNSCIYLSTLRNDKIIHIVIR
jgi:hypothetical protein